MAEDVVFSALSVNAVLPGAPIILFSEAAALYPTPDPPVDAYWHFGADNPTLADIISGQRLRRNVQHTITAAGTGYTTRPTVVYAGGGSDPGKVYPTATALIASGGVTGVVIQSPGHDYDDTLTVSFTGGGGTGATASVHIGAAPTLGAGTLTIPDGNSGAWRNGLLTPFDDSADYSQMVVAKIVSPTSRVFMGSLSLSTTLTGSGGDGLFQLSVSGNNVRTMTGAAALVPVPAAAVGGTFLMMVHKYRSSDAKRTVTYYVNGVPTTFDATVSPAKTVSSPMRKLAFGNGYYQVATVYSALEIAAGAYAGRYLSPEDELALYEYAAEYLPARGVPLL